MLSLYTEELFWKFKLKGMLKKLLNRYNRGPQAVVRSLLQGVADSGQIFSLNNPHPVPGSVACVLNGVQAFRWALEQKRLGVISSVVAGPNIVVMPNDAGSLLRKEAVDAVVVPSEWVKERYLDQAPELEKKIFVWPAGVDLPEIEEYDKKLDFLIYNKLPDSSSLDAVIGVLERKHCSYGVLQYGSFGQENYFRKLESSRYVIYLSESESQGLAMFEAWARNVPTLVMGVWERAKGQATPSPWLSKQSGDFFKDGNELIVLIESLGQRKFYPRQYIEENFTHKKSAQKYMEIISAVHS